jgi:hypothetical protein
MSGGRGVTEWRGVMGKRGEWGVEFYNSLVILGGGALIGA